MEICDFLQDYSKVAQLFWVISLVVLYIRIMRCSPVESFIFEMKTSIQLQILTEMMFFKRLPCICCTFPFLVRLIKNPT